MHKKTFALLLCLSICCLAVAPAFAMDPTPFPTFDAVNLLDEEGANVTQDVFAEADITLMNFWATWCPPCIAELPDLATISELTGGKVQVIGVLVDGVDQFGERDDSAIDAMKALTEDAGVTYPILLPEGTLLALISTMQYIPTTFVVDREGTIYAYEVGSKDADGWIAVAQTTADAAYPEEDIVFAPAAQ